MISDFGISKNLTGAGSTNTFCGTAYYMGFVSFFFLISFFLLP